MQKYCYKNIKHIHTTELYHRWGHSTFIHLLQMIYICKRVFVCLCVSGRAQFNLLAQHCGENRESKQWRASTATTTTTTTEQRHKKKQKQKKSRERNKQQNRKKNKVNRTNIARSFVLPRRQLHTFICVRIKRDITVFNGAHTVSSIFISVLFTTRASAADGDDGGYRIEKGQYTKLWSMR